MDVKATPPPYIVHLVSPKFYIIRVLDFSWDDCNIQEKFETDVIQNWKGWGGGGADVDKVHYSLCESGE